VGGWENFGGSNINPGPENKDCLFSVMVWVKYLEAQAKGRSEIPCLEEGEKVK
jgi:hypothetical protein